MINAVHTGRSLLVAAKIGTRFADALEEVFEVTLFHGLWMNQVERLAAGPAVNAKIAEVGRDDFGLGIAFGQLKHATVRHIHLRPVFGDGVAHEVGIIAEDWLNGHASLLWESENQIDGTLGVREQIAGLRQHDLAGDGRIAEGVQHILGPAVMDISCVGERHQRTRIEDITRISHAQNLPARKGRLGPL